MARKMENNFGLQT